VVQADAGRLGLGLLVAEDEGDVDPPGAQQVQRLRWVGVDQADL
jgi:hypothetical protein